MLDELVKKTIIMVTHDVQEAFEMGDRICLMDRGEIKQIGTPEELLFKPENDFVRGFFDEQRLQLELKSVLLREVFPESDSGGEVSVWDRMDQLLHPENGNVPAGDLKIEDLMRAFETYKRK